ncbi:hypothetical protein LXT21_38905 [Myxococcus sp. K38C18041901]|uniref:hypothetical protein n=1 Tax=Myxococcus guangdongensis TaxID=2906760 RepID=UPI0020A826F2|nr:hypothetical protein [Myxococcus guangdongensis]MCP3064758.1 hypothetical protein [Myxococcus guangdongensis]
MPRASEPPPPSELPRQQDERLRRLEDALSEGQAREDAAIEAWVRKTGRLPPRKVRRQWEKQWRKEARRDASAATRRRSRRRSSNASRDPARAAAFIAPAIACLVLALGQPRRLWWLVFVALGFFLASAKYLRRPTEEEEAEATGLGLRPAAARPVEPVDPKVARVDAVCAKLLAELAQGPAVLREVVHAPERTVEALRQGCHALASRERTLRALATPEEASRLEEEHRALTARVAAERDAVVRERLRGALTALESQRQQRAELSTAADRLEAEYTRLFYTLESLYAQVLRVRTADASGEDVAGLGLRQSVEQLGAEVEAVTEALEEVHRPPDGRVRTR